jgi:hypothetical protein
LQAGVVGMDVLTWQNNAWRTAAPSTGTTGTMGTPAGAPSTAPITGLQVALQVQGQEAAMSKAFLLGGL